ncbi:MAG: substrate-binding domain-containing protein [Candidatus Thiosymbion ectosymbiont of Robbea hypermnestra]|nr:substrate-binding domain-containing protein [Candidatus Thiosymbion ectosymbiont of Robbea hypermnestra]
MNSTRLVVLIVGLLLGPSAFGAPPVIRLATTTSTENSGLLAVLLPPFEQDSGYRVHVIAVGTGKALRLAREGDVDVVLVHARADEDQLVADGYGVNRRDVMYNDFVIVGPPDDPAGIRGLEDAVAALTRIAAKMDSFVSRGDESGTHKRERALWREAGIVPGGRWYREAGQGMGRVLLMAGELDAYTLTDRGTWLAYRDRGPLEILAQGDARLFNPYGIIATNPERHPDVEHTGARRLIEWITSEQGQGIIRDFKRHGQPLFIPMATQAP